jgi:hypothetical protein
LNFHLAFIKPNLLIFINKILKVLLNLFELNLFFLFNF